jgi:hypothetical protein
LEPPQPFTMADLDMPLTNVEDDGISDDVQYADFQEAQEALAPVYDSGLNLYSSIPIHLYIDIHKRYYTPWVRIFHVLTTSFSVLSRA